MFRDINFFAIFRRRFGARNLDKAKADSNEHSLTGPPQPEAESIEKGDEVKEEEAPVKVEDTSSHELDNPNKDGEEECPNEEGQSLVLSPGTEKEDPPFKVPSTTSLDNATDETKEELDLVEEGYAPPLDTRRMSLHDCPVESLDPFSFSLRANRIYEPSDSDVPSSDGCEGSVTSEFTEGTADAGAKDDGSVSMEDSERRKTPNVLTNRAAAGLGWTPGRVRRVNGKNRFVLESVVAITDDLDNIRLDDNLIQAMAGKRGSFSSHSVRTEESEGSEAKRARVWSVFRSRGGRAPP